MSLSVSAAPKNTLLFRIPDKAWGKFTYKTIQSSEYKRREGRRASCYTLTTFQISVQLKHNPSKFHVLNRSRFKRPRNPCELSNRYSRPGLLKVEIHRGKKSLARGRSGYLSSRRRWYLISKQAPFPVEKLDNFQFQPTTMTTRRAAQYTYIRPATTDDDNNTVNILRSSTPSLRYRLITQLQSFL